MLIHRLPLPVGGTSAYAGAMGIGPRRSLWVLPLLGLVSLAPIGDFVIWSMWRQSLQRYADAAAEDGVKALLAGESVEERALTEIPASLDLAAPPAIEHPPRLGAYAGRRDAVRVVLRTVRSPFFLGRILGSRTMTADATAAILRSADGRGTLARVE